MVGAVQDVFEAVLDHVADRNAAAAINDVEAAAGRIDHADGRDVVIRVREHDHGFVVGDRFDDRVVVDRELGRVGRSTVEGDDHAERLDAFDGRSLGIGERFRPVRAVGADDREVFAEVGLDRGGILGDRVLIEVVGSERSIEGLDGEADRRFDSVILDPHRDRGALQAVRIRRGRDREHQCGGRSTRPGEQARE